MCLSLTSKPSNSNSVIDILWFALPFAAIELEDNIRHRGTHKHAPTFNNFHNQLTKYRSIPNKAETYNPGHCVEYRTTEKIGLACKLRDGSWKIQ